MLKHAHRMFPSDISLTLAIVDTQILVGNSADGSIVEMSIEEFLETDMTKKVILSMKIPTHDCKTTVSWDDPLKMN